LSRSTSLQGGYSQSVLFLIIYLVMYLGYLHQRADERHGNPPQGNQELLVVRDKVGRPQVSLGLASPWNVIFSLQCFDTDGWATGRASGM